MDVACSSLDGIEQDQVHESYDRRLAGFLFERQKIDLLILLDVDHFDPCDIGARIRQVFKHLLQLRVIHGPEVFLHRLHQL